jgi:hypothetical protein
MPLYVYSIFTIIILIIGGLATLMIGLSKSNKDSNPAYFKNTKRIFTGLSLYYIITILVGIAGLIVYFTR